MAEPTSTPGSKPTDTARLTIEAWSQGFLIGSLLIMASITLANMRSGVLLHKLILVELVLAAPNGFFTFFNPPVWGWYLSSTAVLLIASWTLHNVISWMKNKPFLQPRGSLIYITTIVLVQPYWVLELYANFTYFNNINHRIFVSSRPLEALCRDPWWIFTTANLFWNIKYRYEFGLIEIIRVSPRFGILLFSMCLSLLFIALDLLAVTPALGLGGINPFWKFASVFKCLTDTIILDDFKTALDKLSRHKMNQIYQLPFSNSGVGLPVDWAEMNGRGAFRASCQGSDDLVSVRQIERVHGNACLSISTADGVPSPLPIAFMRGDKGYKKRE